MTKEEISLNLTIAALKTNIIPKDIDDLCSTICTTYNNIYDNIVINN